MRRSWAPVPPVAVAVLALLAGWLATSTLQQDFAAYYTAGAAVARGLDPYVNHLPRPDGPWDGIAIYKHSRFLYPPLVAELFRPLAALPYVWAKMLFTVASLLSLWGTLTLSLGNSPARVARGAGAREFAQRILPLAWAVWLPVFLALERGQIDLILLLVLAAAWHGRDRPWVAGPLLGIAILGKPLLLGLVPLVLAARRYRWAATTCAAVGVLVLLNLAVMGATLCRTYMADVLPRATVYGEGGPEDLLMPTSALAGVADDLAEGSARIDGAGRSFAQEIGTFRRSASLPRLLAGAASPSRALGVFVFVVLGGLLAWCARRAPESPGWYWGGPLAAVVAAPVSWAMDLVWALPLICLPAFAPMWPPAPGPVFGGNHQRLGSSVGCWLAAALWICGMLGPLFQPSWVLVALLGIATATARSIRRWEPA